MKKLTAALAVVAIMLLLATPGFSAPVSESCTVTLEVAGIYEITVLAEKTIELPMTGFGGTYEIDPNVTIKTNDTCTLSLAIDDANLAGSAGSLINFELGDGAGINIRTSGTDSTTIAPGTYVARLSAQLWEEDPLPIGTWTRIGTITLTSV